MGNSADQNVIDFQIMWNRLLAVVGEQAQVLIRTAFSPIVRECEDVSAGVFDLQGRMLAQAVTGTPGHINSMAESVGHFIRHFPLETMREGDAYITNDPWMGTGHLHDFVVTTPAFHNGKLVGLFSCTSHLMDIGGLGCVPDTTDVFMEGLYIPMLKLVDRGKFNETLMSIIKANTRLPVDSEGDTYSLVACNDVGVRALSAMMSEFEIDTLEPLADFIVSRSKSAVQAAIAKLPKGSSDYTMTMDGFGSPVTIHAKVTISDAGIHVDYAGTSDAVGKGINVPLAYTKAYTAFALGCIVLGEIPNNAGSLSLFTITAPTTSILNAQKPAPVTSRFILGQMLPDMVFGCLRSSLPDLVPAEGTACIWNISVRGRWKEGRRSGQNYALTITTNGGTGGRPQLDGMSATAFPSGVHGTPIEVAEIQAPIMFLRKEFRPDSGGAGEFRGGLGQVMEVVNTEDAEFELLAAYDRVDNPPRGADGGMDGAAGYVGLRSGAVLASKGLHKIALKEKLLVYTPGGGGLGSPSKRSAEKLAEDLRSGLVGEKAARDLYGALDG